jgi:hypothetical protein
MYDKLKDEVRDYRYQVNMFQTMIDKNLASMEQLKPLGEWVDDGYYSTSEPYIDVYGDLITPPDGYIVPGSDEQQSTNV